MENIERRLCRDGVKGGWRRRCEVCGVMVHDSHAVYGGDDLRKDSLGRIESGGPKVRHTSRPQMTSIIRIAFRLCLDILRDAQWALPAMKIIRNKATEVLAYLDIKNSQPK